MRFHVGLSFRLKTLKKFLIPILIGLLTYLFSSGIVGFTNVYAGDNASTYYEYNYPVMDTSIAMGDYTMQDILDYGEYDSQYYYTIPIVEYNIGANLWIVKLFIFPKSISYLNYIYYVYSSSSGTTSELIQKLKPNDTSVSPRYVAIQSNQNASTITSNLNKYLQCVDSNAFCDSMSSMGTLTFGSSYFSGHPNDSYDFIINQTNESNGFIYSSPIPIYYILNNTTGSRYYYKSLKYNGNVYLYDDEFQPYHSNSGGGGDEPGDESYFQSIDLKFRSFYSSFNVSDLSNFNVKYTYKVYDYDNYVNNLDRSIWWYYGRVDHGTYYSYEPITCTNSLTSSDEADNNIINETFNNFSCSSSLTNYDKIYIYNTKTYIDDTNNTIMYGFKITTNYDYYYGNYLGSIYEHFDNLSSGFKILFSNNNSYNPNKVNFITDNDYVGFDLIDNSNITLNHQTSGDWFKTCNKNGICEKSFGEKVYQRNLLVYDDTSYSSATSTDLKIFFVESNTIISFINNGSITYYDNQGNIVSNTLNLTYDSVDNDENYDLNSYFVKVNNFIDDIEGDLSDLHDFIESCYNALPTMIITIIDILYILSLSYLLFKVIRR